MTSILSKLSNEALKDHWRLTFHHDVETATAIDYELSERLGAELARELETEREAA